MVCLGLESGVASWKVQTNPVSYGVPVRKDVGHTVKNNVVIDYAIKYAKRLYAIDPKYLSILGAVLFIALLRFPLNVIVLLMCVSKVVFWHTKKKMMLPK